MTKKTDDFVQMIERAYLDLPAMCENCEQRDGQLNSRYWIDDGCDVGYWVCWECENEMETEFYNERNNDND